MQRRGCARFGIAGSLVLVIFALIIIGGPATANPKLLGAFGPEGARMREQLWLVPSGDPNLTLRATVFRPLDDSERGPAPRQLVVINHGTDEQTRLSVAMPVYYWLSRWFVERGYIVVIPQRRGHGATGGELAESVGTCETADHFASGQIAADDIAATITYMTQQPFVASGDAIVVGISTGGWASLALASRNLPQVSAIVNFAGGRGGHAYGRANAICNSEGLISAARRFGETARAPNLWLYAENDSYFGPELARSLAHEWRAGGGIVEFHALPAYGNDGHGVADDRAGWDIWGGDFDDFLSRINHGVATETAARDDPSADQTALSLPDPAIR